MTAKEMVDLPRMLDWFSRTTAGRKIIDESKTQDVSRRKAIAERLAELRKEEAAVLPPLAQAESDALIRLRTARGRQGSRESGKSGPR